MKNLKELKSVDMFSKILLNSNYLYFRMEKNMNYVPFSEVSEQF